ncbi:MAG TPA: hypothetical protein PK156_43635, partial [Polyangium sp.]|nr:hypothetical protein [Polyangium sp.]
GAGLVADLYRAGGLSLVNTLFLQRPKSTAQVLHPEKYIAGDQPVPVKPPQLPAKYRLLSSNTLGELQTRVVLSACIAPEAARIAAAGWAGDRYTLATRDDDVLALLWTTAWDTEKDAAEFVQVLRQAPTCLGGGIEIAATGKNVSVTRGLDDSIAKETTTSLLAFVGDKPPRTPIGNFVIPMATSPLPPEKGVLWGQTYSSRWLGITGLVPPGLSSQIGAQASELRVSMPGFGVFGSLFVSDTMTVPRFVEELFQSIARGLDDEFGGRALVPIAGGPLALPLGPAIDRWWSLANTSMSVRAIIVPVCSGTGAYVFLQSWPDPAGKQMLDSWLYSFRWASPMTPPICEHLNPR